MLLALVGVAACGQGPRSSVGASGEEVAADYFASEYGVRVGIKVSFEEPRELTDVKLVWDGGSDQVSPYPLDGSDPDAPADTLRLDPGVKALLEGSVLAPCPTAPGSLRFEVTSLADGEERVDRYTPKSQDAFADAFEQWCERPVTINVTGSNATPEGDYTLYLQISNPGPNEAHVVSEAVDDDSGSWDAADVRAPAGEITTLELTGHGPPDCKVTPPWESGNLLLDGTPTQPGGGSATASTEAFC